MLMPWNEALLDCIAPRVCAACRTELCWPGSMHLCGDCALRLPVHRQPACRRCASRVPSGRDHCRPCRSRIFAVDSIRAAFYYEPPLSNLLHAFKYRRRREIGRLLGGWMAGVFSGLAERRNVEAVIPVPLHEARLAVRGFNQAEIIASEIARTANKPLVNCLRRVRDTQPQWTLNKTSRLRNLEDAFTVADASCVKGMSVLLIDDVCTTGGTLEGCAKALQAAGALRISAFVLAKD